MDIDDEVKQIKVTGSKAIESRKKMNFMARYSLSVTILGTFIFLIWLLFFTDLKADSRDLVNILIGAFVAVLAKTTDYWFKDKDDPEHKETEVLNNGTTL
jgi:cytochrome bd-type quinol oxidase subunit 2|tara:strand:- start:169 stop:468 length:300 start_codon:yes stop_codon:yes gene_type:complete